MSIDSNSRTRVLCVDDEPDTTAMITEWLCASGYAADAASNGLDAVACLRDGAYDVVVTDLRMPGLDGHQLLTILEELNPDLPVIVLSGRGSMEDAIRALRGRRAVDYLLKPLSNLRELNAAIDAAVIDRQRTAAVAEVATAIGVAAPVAAPAAVPVPAPNVDPLTETERRMLELLAQGLGNRHIAEVLCFSEKTVRNYLSRLYDKLGVDSRLSAVAFGRQHGLLA